MGPARSDDVEVLFLYNLNRQIPPKGLCEKPNTVLKGERAALLVAAGVAVNTDPHRYMS